MKIALVNNYYYLRGGSERVLFGDQAALQAGGHDARAFAPWDIKNDTAVPGLISQGRMDGGANRLGRPLRAALNVVYSRSVGKDFAAFLDRFRPDVIHCHNIYGRLTTAVLDEAKRRAIPVVLTAHDLKLVCPSYLGLRGLTPCQQCRDGGYWRCVRWKCHKQSRAASLGYTVESYFNRIFGKYDAVSQFLCPSRFMQNSLIDSGISGERTVYHPNALPSSQYNPQFEPGRYVLYVGRLSAEKGIWTLLEAFKQARIPLRIAGTGPLEPEIRRCIHTYGPGIELEGYCSGERLAELYRYSAFTVVPSEWYENASMSSLESFAYGKPVLASAIGGNPELVIERETGRLFRPGRADELAGAACAMWGDRDATESMGRRARRRIEVQFSQERRLAQLMAIYDTVTGAVRET